MKTCIFIGPSLGDIVIPDNVSVYPPAAMGAIFNATNAGYEIIALVDGIFGNVPAVWHKEILYAISKGCVVIGGSSMGAIRASELDIYGMIGIGIAYRLFRRGLTDDDEVCLAHAPEALNYMPISEPMINVRYTARRMKRYGVFNSKSEREFVSKMKNIFFTDRDKYATRECLREVVLPNKVEEAVKLYSDLYFNVKVFDAKLVVKSLKRAEKYTSMKCLFSFPASFHWKEHFEYKLSEIPPLIKKNIT